MVRLRPAAAQALFASGAGATIGAILYGIYSCGDLAMLVVRLMRGD